MAWYARINRSTRLIATGGLAVGLGMGAMAAVHAATSPTPTPSAPAAGSPLRHHGFGRHGFAGGGTITGISGTSVTLRTEAGSETVTTSSSTHYVKEHRSITFAQLAVGDVIHVVPVDGSPPPGSPGTGTIAAGTVVVVMPTVSGRVTSVSQDTVDVVGRDGRLFTVTLSGSTTYRSGQQSADHSAVAVGSRIVAEGTQDSLTHLVADDVTVLPANPPPGQHRGPEAAGDLMPPPGDLPAPPAPPTGIGA